MTNFLTGMINADMVAAFGTGVLVPGYTGKLFTLVRMDDSATMDVMVSGDTFDFEEVLEWLGTSQNRISLIRNQITGIDAPNETNNIPELCFTGLWPSIVGRSDAFDMGNVNGPLATTYKGATIASMLIYRLAGEPRKYQGPSQYIQFAINADGSTRVALTQTEGVHSGPSGGAAVTGIWPDGPVAVQGVGSGQGSLFNQWKLLVGMVDTVTPLFTTWVDTDKYTEAPGALTTGAFSNTNSRRSSLGAFQGGWSHACIMRRAVVDADVTTWLARVPDMFSFTKETTKSIHPARRSFYSFPTEWYSVATGVLTTGYNDRDTKQFIAQIPGVQTTISTRAQNLSDHAAVQSTVINGYFGAFYSGHGDEPSIHGRVSTGATIANLGAEFELSSVQATYNAGTTYPQGAIVSIGGNMFSSLQPNNLNHSPAIAPDWWVVIGEEGDHEYCRIRNQDALDTLFLMSQKADKIWGGWLCTNTNLAPGSWTYSGYMPYVYNAATCYHIDDWINSTLLGMIVYNSPSFPANHLYLMELDFTTGVFAADGVSLGKWDGTPVSGNYLPVNMTTLPIIYTVPATKSIRLLDVGHNCRALLILEWTHPIYAAWSNATTYSLGDKVTRAAELWQSLQNGNLNHTPSENVWWTKIGNEGAGADETTTADYFILTPGDDRYAEWNKTLVCNAGITHDSDNVRWPGACFSNVPHTGYMVHLGRRTGEDEYRAETWTFDPALHRVRPEQRWLEAAAVRGRAGRGAGSGADAL